jgi:uncharacterized protein YvpB
MARGRAHRRMALTLLAVVGVLTACSGPVQVSGGESAGAEPLAPTPAPVITPPRPSIATPAATEQSVRGQVAPTPRLVFTPTIATTPTAAATPTEVVASPVLASTEPNPTDVPASRVLQVPLHRQEHALSCEAAALQMALGTLGDSVTEAELLTRLARDATPRVVLPNGQLIWGDPDLGFVGRWDGVFARDGYGVYEGPIADLARDEGFAGSTALRNADPQILYNAVRAGFPVVVWMPYGGKVKGRGDWMTPSGVRVDYVVTEHAVVMAGVSADEVVYADPYTATLQRANFDDFESAISELDNRAVIVRP